MENKFSGAVTLGYASIFISFWVTYMMVAGWLSGPDIGKASMPLYIIFGGIMLAIAGFFCFFNEGTKTDALVFWLVGGLNFSYALRFMWYANISANSNPAAIDGWIFFVFALVICYLWLSSMKGNVVKGLFMLGLWLTFLAIAIYNWFSIQALSYVAAYLGLITALLAGWYSYTTVMNKGS